MLGSSYFIEKTHGFKVWLAVNAASLAAKVSDPKPSAKKE
jgi:hypothetical protein